MNYIGKHKKKTCCILQQKNMNYKNQKDHFCTVYNRNEHSKLPEKIHIKMRFFVHITVNKILQHISMLKLEISVAA